MIITFILTNGRKIEISDLETTANWIDAAMILFDKEMIDEEELIQLEENPIATEQISSGGDVYNFGNQQFSSSSAEKHTKKPLKRKLRTENQVQSKPRSGLKKKSSSKPSTPVEAKIMNKKQSQPTQLNKKQPQTTQLNKKQSMPPPPTPRRDIKLYEMDLNCSKTGKKWTAKLEGLTPPSKGGSQSQPKPQSAGKRTIYFFTPSWQRIGLWVLQ